MISVNGKKYSGTNIIVNDDTITIDGKEIADFNLPDNIVEIRVIGGSIESLKSDVSVACEDIKGNVEAGGSVNCDDIGGDVHAGGSVNCDRIGGDVSAGGSVNSL